MILTYPPNTGCCSNHLPLWPPPPLQDRSCERLTELALNDAGVASTLLRQALAEGAAELADLPETAAAFQQVGVPARLPWLLAGLAGLLACLPCTPCACLCLFLAGWLPCLLLPVFLSCLPAGLPAAVLFL